jgi:predicted DNA-binding transcriptional regulator AlpA
MKTYPLDQWLQLRDFSRPFWYVLKKRGEAPRHFNVGRRVFVTEEADAEWLKAREAESVAA